MSSTSYPVYIGPEPTSRRRKNDTQPWLPALRPAPVQPRLASLPGPTGEPRRPVVIPACQQPMATESCDPPEPQDDQRHLRYLHLLPRLEERAQAVRNLSELNIEPAAPPEPVRRDPTPIHDPPSDHCSLLHAMDMEVLEIEPPIPDVDAGDLRVPRPFWMSRGFLAALGVVVCLALVIGLVLKLRRETAGQEPGYGPPPPVGHGPQPAAAKERATPADPKTISLANVTTETDDGIDETEGETVISFPPEPVSASEPDRRATGNARARRARTRARAHARRSARARKRARRWARRARRVRAHAKRNVDVDALLTAGGQPERQSERPNSSRANPDTILASARSNPDKRTKPWRSGYRPTVPGWMK